MSVVKNNPLSYPIPEFVTCYWPGVMKCCSQVLSNRIELTQHLIAIHSNIGENPLRLALAPPIGQQQIGQQQIAQQQLEAFSSLSSSCSSSPACSLKPPPPSTNIRKRPSVMTSSPPSIDDSGTTRRNQSSSSNLAFRGGTSFMANRGLHDESERASLLNEARQLRLETKERVSLKDVVKAMERLLELSYFVAKWMEDLPVDCGSVAPNAKKRAPYIELFDYIWQSSEIVLSRWESSLKNQPSSDHILNSIKFQVLFLINFILFIFDFNFLSCNLIVVESSVAN